MVMENLSEKLWTQKTLESIRNGKMKSQDDLVYGKSYIDLKARALVKNTPEHSKDWKLLIDPFIKGKHVHKVTRFGGLLTGPDELPVVVRDPRDKHTPIRKTKDIDLLVPKFKFDKWSVGSPPLRSIFIHGLNDNVNQDFLSSLFTPHGSIEQLKVYYHPKNRKHLGIAFASFTSTSVTKEVVAKYHGTSIMGNIVNIKPDPLCQITKKVLDHVIRYPVANIPDIIQHVQLKSQHKTAVYAFRHNERSQNYYTARGKVRKPSDTVAKHAVPEKGAQQVAAYQPLKLEQVSPKVDTPPPPADTMIKPEDISENDEKSVITPDPPKKREVDLDESYEVKHKCLKSELGSPDLVEEKRKDARLFELDKDRKRAHEDRKYEEWKLRTELQIRADKTNRYVKEHCSGSAGGGGGHSSSSSTDKYSAKSAEYHAQQDHYYKYYEKYYRSSKDAARYHDEKYWAKYEKYKYETDKYYDYHRYHSTDKRSSSTASSLSKEFYEKIHKLEKSGKERYELYHRDSDYRDSVKELERLERYKHLDHRDPERARSKSRPHDEPYLPERASKRKRSKSPYHNLVLENKKSPAAIAAAAAVAAAKSKAEKSGSATSHDTGYSSISPLPPSPTQLPKPPSQTTPTPSSDNPYGCARAVPRKDISKLKAVGFKQETVDSRSSSPMSLEGDSDQDPDMRVEDISPNNTPKYPAPPDTAPAPAPAVVPPPVLLPPVLPVHYQTGQWLHTSYPGMYQYGYESYNPEEAADILARREAEEKAAAKQRELELSRQRRSDSLNLLLEQMESVLKRDIKMLLNEKVAFAQLEVVWNLEEDKKKREEEELLAALREQHANNLHTDNNSKAPDMPSLSEMRNLSDAKSDSHIRQQSHIRQANLSFKVPKLNRMSGLKQQLGMRAQVIVKKMAPPLEALVSSQIRDHEAEEEEEERSVEEEEINEEELLCKPRRQVGSRYNTIYSTSSSSSETEEDEVCTQPTPAQPDPALLLKHIETPPTVPDKYAPRSEEEEELIQEQMFREELSPEDKLLFKLAYDRLCKEGDGLLEGVTWLTPPEIPVTPRRRQLSADLKHRTGCARTEGFYKISSEEKMATKLSNLNKNVSEQVAQNITMKKKVDGKTTARSTRATQRRQATHYYDIDDVQYLQLSTRRKQVRFQRSDIHDWGLFAQEPISADEMVIEYVGEVVREIIANVRERGYVKQGIGSSYLFRIDQSSYIVDATHRGSISRFINHNCDPNCYARVISVVGQKKIVIYSKRDIAANEEITYDYKFAIEDDENKIRCLCNAAACRGFLN